MSRKGQQNPSRALQLSLPLPPTPRASPVQGVVVELLHEGLPGQVDGVMVVHPHSILRLPCHLRGAGARRGYGCYSAQS